MLLIIQTLVVNHLTRNTTTSVELGLNKGYQAALVASDMRADIILVWQYLTDVSATHDVAGFTDAERAAKDLAQKAATLKRLHPDKVQQIDSTVAAFGRMYAQGRRMANAYVRQGREAGNMLMPEFDRFGDDLSGQMDALRASITRESQSTLEQAVAQSQLSNRVGFALNLVVIALILFVSFAISALIVRRLHGLVATASALALGDVDQQVQVDTRDELGQLALAFQEMIGYQQAMAQTARTVTDRNLMHDVVPKSERDQLGHEFKQMVYNLRLFVGSVSVNAEKMGEASTLLSAAAGSAAGASERVGASYRDVAQAVAQSTTTSEEIARASEQQATSATDAAQAMGQLSDAVRSVGRGSRRQAEAIQEVEGALQHTTKALEALSTGASLMTKAAGDATRVSTDGGQAVKEAAESLLRIQQQVQVSSERVQDLGAKGQQIGVIVETIKQIAEQTNLLALNAAIEAARAGEHGKGFAVVAAEVGKLAKRADQATQAIDELVGGIRTGVDEVVKAMASSDREVEVGAKHGQAAGTALTEILASIERVAGQTEQMAHTVGRLSEAAQTVEVAVGTVQHSLQENQVSVDTMTSAAQEVEQAITNVASISEQTSAGAQEMSGMAADVSHSVDGVALALGEQHQAAADVHEAAVQLLGISTHLMELVHLFEWDRRRNESEEQFLAYKERRKMTVDEAAQRILVARNAVPPADAKAPRRAA